LQKVSHFASLESLNSILFGEGLITQDVIFLQYLLGFDASKKFCFSQFVWLPFRGDCATCEIFLAGRLTKPCVAKVPAEPTLKSLKEKGLEIRV